jgi:uncharacterized protein (DUF2236 family)
MTSRVRGLSDIAGETALIAGGGRAILLQVANPAVGRGVAEHSDFYNRPLNRLTATLTFIYAVTYGSEEEVAFVRRRVNHAHVPVHGTGDGNSDGDGDGDGDGHDDATGAPAYDAFDPQLQLWVAATLYETAITLYERIFGPIEEVVAERIYREYAVLGTALQMQPELWPASRAEFRQYWSEQIGQLVVDDTIRHVAGQLLHPATLPIVLRPFMPSVRLITAGLLDDNLRHQFRIPWSDRRQHRYDRLLNTMGAILPRLPGRIRHVLRDYYLRSLRKDIAAESRLS